MQTHLKIAAEIKQVEYWHGSRHILRRSQATHLFAGLMLGGVLGLPATEPGLAGSPSRQAVRLPLDAGLLGLCSAKILFAIGLAASTTGRALCGGVCASIPIDSRCTSPTLTGLSTAGAASSGAVRGGDPGGALPFQRRALPGCDALSAAAMVKVQDAPPLLGCAGLGGEEGSGTGAVCEAGTS